MTLRSPLRSTVITRFIATIGLSDFCAVITQPLPFHGLRLTLPLPERRRSPRYAVCPMPSSPRSQTPVESPQSRLPRIQCPISCMDCLVYRLLLAACCHMKNIGSHLMTYRGSITSRWYVLYFALRLSWLPSRSALSLPSRFTPSERYRLLARL